MELEEVKIQIKRLKDAYTSLREGIEKDNLSLLERDGVIQRFEYTVEFTWKTLRKILAFEGEDGKIFAKEVLKRFYEIGIIENLEIFLKFLEVRNVFSHTYDSATSEDLFDFIKKNYLNFESLIKNLEKKFN